eukprot:g55084.t1
MEKNFTVSRSKRCGPKRSHGLSIVISEAVEISKPKIDYAYAVTMADASGEPQTTTESRKLVEEGQVAIDGLCLFRAVKKDTIFLRIAVSRSWGADVADCHVPSEVQIVMSRAPPQQRPSPRSDGSLADLVLVTCRAIFWCVREHSEESSDAGGNRPDSSTKQLVSFFCPGRLRILDASYDHRGIERILRAHMCGILCSKDAVLMLGLSDHAQGTCHDETPLAQEVAEEEPERKREADRGIARLTRLVALVRAADTAQERHDQESKHAFEAIPRPLATGAEGTDIQKTRPKKGFRKVKEWAVLKKALVELGREQKKLAPSGHRLRKPRLNQSSKQLLVHLENKRNAFPLKLVDLPSSRIASLVPVDPVDSLEQRHNGPAHPEWAGDPAAEEKNRTRREEYVAHKKKPQLAWMIQRIQDLLPLQACLPVSTPSSPISIVVDVGCGRGDLSLNLATLFPRTHVLALDRNRHSLKAGHERAKALGLRNVTFVCADATELLNASFASVSVISGADFSSPDFQVSSLGSQWPLLFGGCLDGGSAATWSFVSASDGRRLCKLAELQGEREAARKSCSSSDEDAERVVHVAMHSVNSLRLDWCRRFFQERQVHNLNLWRQSHKQLGEIELSYDPNHSAPFDLACQLLVFPERYSLKNMVLQGRPAAR